MKRFKTQLAYQLSFWILAFAFFSCQNDPNDFEEATYSKNPEVFIDTFSAGLNFSSYGGAVVDAFQVDADVAYNNSAASMRFDVPNVNDPAGSYAGGSFYTSVGRDLTQYDALTFWAKSTVAATIDVVGFGNDFGDNKYQAAINGLQISTVWRKYIIPIPDPSKLTQEKGMFFISEGPENGNGYTFWIDEVRFEKLGTINPQQPQILNGQNLVQTAYAGVTNTIAGLVCAFNMPNGINQIVNVTPAYFTFTSSNPAVATVDEQGLVTTVGAGTAVITATVNGVEALGSLTINSSGEFVHADTPTRDASDVISIFSDAYTNVPVNYYNGYWQPYQTTQSADFTVNQDNVLNYTNFNFVGIEFTSPTIDASGMSHLHIDVYIPNAIPAGANFQVQLIDAGADGALGGGNDTNATVTFTAPTLVSQNWISLNIPLAQFAALGGRAHLAQLIFVGANVTNFYADNIYFYNDGSVISPVPTTAAPAPSYAPGDVISVFSDAYTNIAGSDLNPNWGQVTVASQVAIGGNNTLKYAGLNYQGLQLGSATDVSSKNFLHLDYYSANSTALNVYLISGGPTTEQLHALTVPTTSGWNSVDIPLSQFAPVNLANIIQLKFDGNGDIYLDNILFRN
ncbi:Ig-like domain-containing protein [Flavobacterium silvaticum]|uniref:Glycosyl hydrolase family 16 n=1 Tax=Flavobacterium silvaticum TaxID=1852020 RepID=A0A972JGX3_9FLAO|nr:Ig-like domain-containing protein [Flavobacterium silvaticum]NMH28646.1 glycosyl hydrolase family 16 [Flavobacterium silvaticum]